MNHDAFGALAAYVRSADLGKVFFLSIWSLLIARG